MKFVKAFIFTAAALAGGVYAQDTSKGPKPSTKATIIKKVGNVTSVVEDVPPVPPKCRVIVTTSPKSSDEALTLWFYDPQDGTEIESEEPNKIVVLVPVGVERDYRFTWVGREPKGKQKTERVTVRAGKGPKPPPDPDPEPPTPDPDTKPPIDDPGVHALIIFETGAQTDYTQGQIGFMYSQEVRTYLSSKCTKGTNSSGWYMVDQNAVMAALPPFWGKAMDRPRTKLPWMILSDGKKGWEGPVPDRYEDAFAKVKEFIK